MAPVCLEYRCCCLGESRRMVQLRRKGEWEQPIHKLEEYLQLFQQLQNTH
jgi:hypothetical protein